MKTPQVGIFWIIETAHGKDLITDAVPVSQGEKYGDAIQHGGHYEFWESLTPRSQSEVLFKSKPYDAYPRGRVVFFPRQKRFTLHADRCISAASHGRIMDTFQIGESDFIIKGDEHYRCVQCNPFFVDI